MTLDEALEHVQVDSRDYRVAVSHFPYAVTTGHRQVIALFTDEADACRFRLSYINGMLNPVEDR